MVGISVFRIWTQIKIKSKSGRLVFISDLPDHHALLHRDLDCPELPAHLTVNLQRHLHGHTHQTLRLLDHLRRHHLEKKVHQPLRHLHEFRRQHLEKNVHQSLWLNLHEFRRPHLEKKVRQSLWLNLHDLSRHHLEEKIHQLLWLTFAVNT